MFCREDGTPLDRWHVRKEFQKITKAARLGGAWTSRELRHSFVSILSANDVRLEDISDLVGYSSMSVTETVYRHVIRPALTKGAVPAGSTHTVPLTRRFRADVTASGFYTRGDAKITQICGGINQIQRLVMARQLLVA